MTAKDIEKQASDLVTSKIGNGEIVEMNWAVRELIAGMGGITGDGEEFYTLCADFMAWRIVKRIVGKYDLAGRTSQCGQLDLDGFGHMQKGYTVKRGETIKLVPVEMLSDWEILKRADEYDKISSALTEHANELRDFVNRRSSVQEIEFEFPTNQPS